jgi:hypothetical protein
MLIRVTSMVRIVRIKSLTANDLARMRKTRKAHRTVAR